MQWPRYRAFGPEGTVDPLSSDGYFVFDPRLGVSSYLRDQQCNFWEPFFFRSALGVVPAAAR